MRGLSAFEAGLTRKEPVPTGEFITGSELETLQNAGSESQSQSFVQRLRENYGMSEHHIIHATSGQWYNTEGCR